MAAPSTIVWISGATEGLGLGLAGTCPYPGARIINLSRRRHPQPRERHVRPHRSPHVGTCCRALPAGARRLQRRASDLHPERLLPGRRRLRRRGRRRAARRGGDRERRRTAGAGRRLRACRATRVRVRARAPVVGCGRGSPSRVAPSTPRRRRASSSSSGCCTASAHDGAAGRGSSPSAPGSSTAHRSVPRPSSTSRRIRSPRRSVAGSRRARPTALTHAGASDLGRVASATRRDPAPVRPGPFREPPQRRRQKGTLRCRHQPLTSSTSSSSCEHWSKAMVPICAS